ncbi:MAG TPA: hypothetical protein ENJ28_02910 [Gammaproteobacteria bacterium]|nr:hypothetical protein [Gammaproteobacteria bacterium]
MSGGSWDYFYTKCQDTSERLDSSSCPYRRALGKKMDKIAKAMHDIEWVDSGDYGSYDDIQAIKDSLGADGGMLVFEEVKEDIRKTISLLESITKL